MKDFRNITEADKAKLHPDHLAFIEDFMGLVDKARAAKCYMMAEWLMYRLACVPFGTSEARAAERQEDFYAGAMSAFLFMSKDIGMEVKNGNVDGLMKFIAMSDEMVAFTELMQKKKTPLEPVE